MTTERDAVERLAAFLLIHSRGDRAPPERIARVVEERLAIVEFDGEDIAERFGAEKAQAAALIAALHLIPEPPAELVERVREAEAAGGVCHTDCKGNPNAYDADTLCWHCTALLALGRHVAEQMAGRGGR